MRRTIGAILIETRPERMSRSAWRGEARKASKPKRAMSTREPTIDIISIAQQASPNVAGKSELPRAQFERLVERRREHALLDVLLEVGALEVAAEHVARAQLAGAEVARGPPRRELALADYLHSSAPRRQTYTKATNSSAMKTMVSTSAKVPKARSWTATG